MIKKIFPYVKKYRVYALLSPAMMICEAYINIVIPLIMGKIVNEGIMEKNSPLILRLGLIMIGLALLAAAVGGVTTWLSATAGYGTATELRNQAYQCIQTYSFNDLDRMKIPSLITRLTTDTDTFAQILIMTLRIAVRGPFVLIFALVFAMKKDLLMALIFFVVIPAMAIGMVIIFKSAYPFFEELRKRTDGVNSVVQEELTGIRVIKAFNRQTFAEERFGKVNQAYLKTSLEAIRRILRMGPLMNGMICLCMILVLFFGGRGIDQGKMDPGTLIIFISYTGQILMAVMMISMYVINAIYAVASIHRIFEVIDLVPDQKVPLEAVKEVKDGSVVFDHVVFRYPGFKEPVLNDISLQIPAGARIGIIGSTGSSKSTLIQMIPRLYDAEKGQVLVGGVDVNDYDPKTLRDAISYVFQENILVSGTIRSNLYWGNPKATEGEMILALKAAQAWEFVKEYPELLDAPVAQAGANFSGGQKQRLTIARALLKKPKILIFDDAASALDMETDERLRQSIQESFSGITVFMVSQRVASIKDFDQIIVMEEGRVESFGPHQELMEKSPIYREIVQCQKGGLSQ